MLFNEIPRYMVWFREETEYQSDLKVNAERKQLGISRFECK